MPVCPRQPFVLVRNDDPRVRVAKPCGSYQCDTCRQAKVAERVKVVAWAANQADRVRLITLTKCPDSWQRSRAQLRDYVRRLRKKFSIELAWSIEENPRKTGYHAHALQWGDFLPKKILTSMWGGRWTDIREIPRDKTSYISKCATVAGYTAKNVGLHLEANGGRAIHLTRGFLHGFTSREVLSILSQGHSWHVERATSFERLSKLPASSWEHLDRLQAGDVIA